jgi:hypothetical protein
MFPLVTVAANRRMADPIQERRYAVFGYGYFPVSCGSTFEADFPELFRKKLAACGIERVGAKTDLSQVSLVGVKTAVSTVPKIDGAWAKGNILGQNLFAKWIPTGEEITKVWGYMAKSLVGIASPIPIRFCVGRPKLQSKFSKYFLNPSIKFYVFAIVTKPGEACYAEMLPPVLKAAVTKKQSVHGVFHSHSPMYSLLPILHRITTKVNTQMGNQQPSTVQVKVQRPGDIPRRVQADPKREAAQRIASKIWSTLHGNAQRILDDSGIKWYYQCSNIAMEDTMKITLEVVERFHEKWVVNKENGCWEWTASLAGKGYGQMKVPGTRRQEYAHRISYMIHCGNIPGDMQVCHTCDNPKCVKPSHLFLGTSGDNHLDMKEKDRHLNGERNKKAKLTEEQVRRIHELHSQGMSQGKIGEAFGVSQGQVFRILHGIQWQHIYREIKSGRL